MQKWSFNTIFEGNGRENVKRHQVTYHAIWHKDRHSTCEWVEFLCKTTEPCWFTNCLLFFFLNKKQHWMPILGWILFYCQNCTLSAGFCKNSRECVYQNGFLEFFVICNWSCLEWLLLLSCMWSFNYYFIIAKSAHFALLDSHGIPC